MIGAAAVPTGTPPLNARRCGTQPLTPWTGYVFHGLYTIQTAVTGEFDDVVDTTIAALKDEGFGVLCDIDIQATLKEKLGEEFRQYRILGACNPPLAHEGLTEEIELGALLPCNVIVYETDDGEVMVSAVDPQQLVGIADNDALDSIATEVTERFERVLSAVTDELGSRSEV